MMKKYRKGNPDKDIINSLRDGEKDKFNNYPSYNATFTTRAGKKSAETQRAKDLKESDKVFKSLKKKVF